MKLCNITKVINEKIYYNKYKKRKNILNIYLKDILIYKSS